MLPEVVANGICGVVDGFVDGAIDRAFGDGRHCDPFVMVKLQQAIAAGPREFPKGFSLRLPSALTMSANEHSGEPKVDTRSINYDRIELYMSRWDMCMS